MFEKIYKQKRAEKRAKHSAATAEHDVVSQVTHR